MSMRIHNKVGGYAPIAQENQTNKVTTEKTSQPRLTGFNQYSSYEKVDSVTFSDGSSLTIPQLDPGQQQQIQQIYEGLTPEQQAGLQASGREFAARLMEVLADPRAHGADGQPNYEFIQSQVGAQTAATSEQYMLAHGDDDFEQSVAGVIMLGVEGLQGELSDFAGYVQGNIDAMNDMRSDISDIRDGLANWPEGAETQPFSWTERTPDGQVIEHENVQLTREQAQTLTEKLEGQLDSMREMSELDKFKLQDLYQRYNEAVTTLSNIMKMQHDTLKAIINNLRG